MQITEINHSNTRSSSEEQPRHNLFPRQLPMQLQMHSVTLQDSLFVQVHRGGSSICSVGDALGSWPFVSISVVCIMFLFPGNILTLNLWVPSAGLHVTLGLNRPRVKTSTKLLRRIKKVHEVSDGLSSGLVQFFSAAFVHVIVEVLVYFIIIFIRIILSHTSSKALLGVMNLEWHTYSHTEIIANSISKMKKFNLSAFSCFSSDKTSAKFRILITRL